MALNTLPSNMSQGLSGTYEISMVFIGGVVFIRPRPRNVSTTIYSWNNKS